MPARSQPQIPIDRLRKYISDGMTVRAICERTGKSDVAVYAQIKAAGMGWIVAWRARFWSVAFFPVAVGQGSASQGRVR
ncbi:MAG: hypothetical protein EBR23_12310 [Planctomycetia bacterium]|nr:hypothetical protein [Planctomycetia bacterium]